MSGPTDRKNNLPVFVRKNCKLDTFFRVDSFSFSSVITCLYLLLFLYIISFSLCPSLGDSWLDITTQDLEHMLQERSGGRADISSQSSSSTQQTQCVNGTEERRRGTEDGQEEEEGAYSLVAVSQGMKNFLNAMSSHEGAELPW